MLAEPEKFTDFSYLTYWSKTFQQCAGLAIFMGFVKIFKYISFNKTMSQLSGTLKKAMQICITLFKIYHIFSPPPNSIPDIFIYIFQSLPELATFGFMFMLMFVAFAQFAYIVFGSQMSDYSTMTKCIYTQFRMVLGDFDFRAIRAAHPTLGPMYFFVFIFLVLFILMVNYQKI